MSDWESGTLDDDELPKDDEVGDLDDLDTDDDDDDDDDWSDDED